MAWWNRRPVVARDYSPPHIGPSFSVGDPALVEYLGLGGYNDAGENVTEASALGLTAVYRSWSIISGTIAGLPLKTYRTTGDQGREQVPSFLDAPGSTYFTPFEWKQLVLVHMLSHGNAYLLHLYNGGGALDGLFPIHPGMVRPRWLVDDQGRVLGKVFDMQVNGQTVTKDETEMTQIMLLSVDGLEGVSPISAMRNALGTGLAANKAAARMFSSGLLLGGLVSSDENLTEENAREVKASLKDKMSGTKNAGDIAIVNASLKFTPWTMNAEDAQFLEARAFQVEEIARMHGVPKVLLAEDGASTWGSGIAELLNGFAKFTLNPLTSTIEERISTLLPTPRHAEFEYVGLLQASPAVQIPLLIQQVEAGLLTIDEARAIQNLPPLTPPAAPAANPESEPL